MTDNLSIDREALISQALKHGFKQDMLERTPTYALVDLIREATNKGTSREETETFHSEEARMFPEVGEDFDHPEDQAFDPSLPPPPDLRSSRRQRRRHEHWHRSHQNRHSRRRVPHPEVEAHVSAIQQNLQDQKREEDFDDSATVVDMAHVTESGNPSDRKYKRFCELACVKKDLTDAIRRNTELLKTTLSRLDEDDVGVLKREIQSSQYQLNLVNGEIKQINHWFQEVYAERRSFYQSVLENSSDITGELTKHFERKMKNIEEYNRSMNEHSQQVVQETTSA